MTVLLATVATAVLAYACGSMLPWWGVAVAAVLVGYLVKQRPLMSALSGFFGVFLLWTGHAAYIHQANQGVLSERIAMLLPLHGNVVLLIIMTGVVGGIVAALSALTGAFLRGMGAPPISAG